MRNGLSTVPSSAEVPKEAASELRVPLFYRRAARLTRTPQSPVVKIAVFGVRVSRATRSRGRARVALLGTAQTHHAKRHWA